MSDPAERLVSMSNQIAGFFRAYPEEEAVSGIADHIAKFWDRKMRATILNHFEQGSRDLDPLVVLALERLKIGTSVA